MIYPTLDWPFDAPVLAWNLALFSVAGSRLILNFHEFHHRDSQEDVSSERPESFNLTTINNAFAFHPVNLNATLDDQCVFRLPFYFHPLLIGLKVPAGSDHNSPSASSSPNIQPTRA